MNKYETAKKLAEITGRPITDFFKGEFDAELGERHDDTISDERSVAEVTTASPTEEQKSLLKHYLGSTLHNGKLIHGRQMTRKEYLKVSKDLDQEELGEHPLLYKMFRSENQTEVFFPRWMDTFTEVEYVYEDEE